MSGRNTAIRAGSFFVHEHRHLPQQEQQQQHYHQKKSATTTKRQSIRPILSLPSLSISSFAASDEHYDDDDEEEVDDDDDDDDDDDEVHFMGCCAHHQYQHNTNGSNLFSDGDEFDDDDDDDENVDAITYFSRQYQRHQSHSHPHQHDNFFNTRDDDEFSLLIDHNYTHRTFHPWCSYCVSQRRLEAQFKEEEQQERGKEKERQTTKPQLTLTADNYANGNGHVRNRSSFSEDEWVDAENGEPVESNSHNQIRSQHLNQNQIKSNQQNYVAQHQDQHQPNLIARNQYIAGSNSCTHSHNNCGSIQSQRKRLPRFSKSNAKYRSGPKLNDLLKQGLGSGDKDLDSDGTPIGDILVNKKRNFFMNYAQKRAALAATANASAVPASVSSAIPPASATNRQAFLIRIGHFMKVIIKDLDICEKVQHILYAFGLNKFIGGKMPSTLKESYFETILQGDFGRRMVNIGNKNNLNSTTLTCSELNPIIYWLAAILKIDIFQVVERLHSVKGKTARLLRAFINSEKGTATSSKKERVLREYGIFSSLDKSFLSKIYDFVEGDEAFFVSLMVVLSLDSMMMGITGSKPSRGYKHNEDDERARTITHYPNGLSEQQKRVVSQTNSSFDRNGRRNFDAAEGEGNEHSGHVNHFVNNTKSNGTKVDIVKKEGTLKQDNKITIKPDNNVLPKNHDKVKHILQTKSIQKEFKVDRAAVDKYRKQYPEFAEQLDIVEDYINNIEEYKNVVPPQFYEIYKKWSWQKEFGRYEVVSDRDEILAKLNTIVNILKHQMMDSQVIEVVLAQFIYAENFHEAHRAIKVNFQQLMDGFADMHSDAKAKALTKLMQLIPRLTGNENWKAEIKKMVGDIVDLPRGHGNDKQQQQQQKNEINFSSNCKPKNAEKNNFIQTNTSQKASSSSNATSSSNGKKIETARNAEISKGVRKSEAEMKFLDKLKEAELEEKQMAQQLHKQKQQWANEMKADEKRQKIAKEIEEVKKKQKIQKELEKHYKEKQEAERKLKEQQQQQERECKLQEKKENEIKFREKQEAENRAKEQQEAERQIKLLQLEAEKQAREKEENERKFREKQEAEKRAKEQQDAEERAKEQKQDERKAKQKQLATKEAEINAREKLEKEKEFKKKQEIERKAREKQQYEEIQRENLEQEKKLKEKMEAERKTKEEAEKEEKAAKQNLRVEKAEKTRAEAHVIKMPELEKSQKALKQKLEDGQLKYEEKDRITIEQANANTNASDSEESTEDLSEKDKKRQQKLNKEKAKSEHKLYGKASKAKAKEHSTFFEKEREERKKYKLQRKKEEKTKAKQRAAERYIASLKDPIIKINSKEVNEKILRGSETELSTAEKISLFEKHQAKLLKDKKAAAAAAESAAAESAAKNEQDVSSKGSNTGIKQSLESTKTNENLESSKVNIKRSPALEKNVSEILTKDANEEDKHSFGNNDNGLKNISSNELSTANFQPTSVNSSNNNNINNTIAENIASAVTSPLPEFDPFIKRNLADSITTPVNSVFLNNASQNSSASSLDNAYHSSFPPPPPSQIQIPPAPNALSNMPSFNINPRATPASFFSANNGFSIWNNYHSQNSSSTVVEGNNNNSNGNSIGDFGRAFMPLMNSSTFTTTVNNGINSINGSHANPINFSNSILGNQVVSQTAKLNDAAVSSTASAPAVSDIVNGAPQTSQENNLDVDEEAFDFDRLNNEIFKEVFDDDNDDDGNPKDTSNNMESSNAVKAAATAPVIDDPAIKAFKIDNQISAFSGSGSKAIPLGLNVKSAQVETPGARDEPSKQSNHARVENRQLSSGQGMKLLLRSENGDRTIPLTKGNYSKSNSEIKNNQQLQQQHEKVDFERASSGTSKNRPARPSTPNSTISSAFSSSPPLSSSKQIDDYCLSNDFILKVTLQHNLDIVGSIDEYLEDELAGKNLNKIGGRLVLEELDPVQVDKKSLYPSLKKAFADLNIYGDLNRTEPWTNMTRNVYKLAELMNVSTDTSRRVLEACNNVLSRAITYTLFNHEKLYELKLHNDKKMFKVHAGCRKFEKLLSFVDANVQYVAISEEFYIKALEYFNGSVGEVIAVATILIKERFLKSTWKDNWTLSNTLLNNMVSSLIDEMSFQPVSRKSRKNLIKQ